MDEKRIRRKYEIDMILSTRQCELRLNMCISRDLI